jgi:hypothetical protein
MRRATGDCVTNDDTPLKLEGLRMIFSGSSIPLGKICLKVIVSQTKFAQSETFSVGL